MKKNTKKQKKKHLSNIKSVHGHVLDITFLWSVLSRKRDLKYNIDYLADNVSLIMLALYIKVRAISNVPIKVAFR